MATISKHTRNYGIDRNLGGYILRDDNLPDTPDTLDFADKMWWILDVNGNLLLKKHEAYGPTNIAAAPGGALNGLRVRMHDKLARLNHIVDNPGVDTNDESLEDTLRDLANYATIGIMVLKGWWPE